MKRLPDQPEQNHNRMREGGMEDVKKRLLQLARRQGAHGAAMIDVQDIVVEDRLAGLCHRPGCPNYGIAPSCPPHVGGPDQFRQWQKKYHRAVVIRIDVPTQILLSENRGDVFRQLHGIAALIEHSAIDSGYKNAKAFAGGSCKELFCADLPACPVITANGPCRYPDWARPSMSGYGIDVSRLMAAAGWQTNRIISTTQTNDVPMGPITALVLID